MKGTIENGLLLYLLDEISRSISPKTIDLMGILHLRNEIAANISAISFENLPGSFAHESLSFRHCLVFKKNPHEDYYSLYATAYDKYLKFDHIFLENFLV